MTTGRRLLNPLTASEGGRDGNFLHKRKLNLPPAVPRGASERYVWSGADAAAVISGLMGRAMRGRHESPGHRTDAFMALVVLALLAILAAVLIAALTGG